MISLISGRLRRLRESRASEDGFTIIEFAMATGIILVGLVSLMYTTLVGLADIATARSRQSATSMVNQTIEQMRALSEPTLAAGMNTTDLANSLSGGSTPDGAITTSGGNYYFEGEQIPATGATQSAPLNPHRSTRAVGTTTFTLSTYLTYYQNNPNGDPPTFRATVVATWSAGQKRTVTNTVRAQSLFYAPNCSSCGSDSTHQYTAPRQAYFYALAGSGQGLIHLSGTVAGISDFTASSGIDLDLPQTEAVVQTEQLTHAQGKAETSGTGLTAASLQSSGGQQAANVTASNDPNNASYYNTATASGPNSVTLSDTQGLNVISTISSGTDTASATATTSAGQPSSYICNNTAGVGQLDGLGCANGLVRQMQSESASVAVNPSGVGVAAATLVSVAGQPATSPSPQMSYAKRDIASSGNCTGDGCTDAKQTRNLGTVQIGAFPAGFTGPAGWAGYLVRVTAYSDSVFAQSGVSPGATTATAGGTISYWNGTAYQTINYTGTPVTIPVGSASATGTVGTSLVMATLSASNMAAAGKSTTTTTTGCGTGNVCSASATSGSPIVGDVNYTIGLSALGVITSALADIDLHVDLGSLQAQTTYTPAP